MTARAERNQAAHADKIGGLLKGDAHGSTGRPGLPERLLKELNSVPGGRAVVAWRGVEALPKRPAEIADTRGYGIVIPEIIGHAQPWRDRVQAVDRPAVEREGFRIGSGRTEEEG